MPNRLITAEIDLGYVPPPQLRGNRRTHWARKSTYIARLRESGNAYGLKYASEFIELKPDMVKVSYSFTNKRQIDIDNLIIGMKPFLDGLVDARVLVDDKSQHCSLEKSTFEKGEPRTVVRLEAEV